MIEIQEATKSQAAEIARLIMMAMTDDCCLYFCGDGYGLDDFQKMMTMLVEREDSQYSYKNTLVAKDCNKVVGISVSYDGGRLHEFRRAFIEAAKEYPDVQFCHATGTKAHTENLANLHNAFASIYEGRYLSGIAAGMKLNQMIEEGKIKPEEAKIGYIGAYTYAEVISGYTSFFLGARSVCPSATMEVTFTGSWYDETLEKEAATTQVSETTAKVADTLSQEPRDTVGELSEPVQQDSVSDVPVQAAAKSSLTPVYMGVWGNVGGTGFLLDMDGLTGSYIPYDMGEGKEYGQRRKLELVSYDPNNGKCIINAFLNKKYIGQFDGVFMDDEFEDDEGNTHGVQSFDGIFKSVNGSKLDFHFHFD